MYLDKPKKLSRGFGENCFYIRFDLFIHLEFFQKKKKKKEGKKRKKERKKHYSPLRFLYHVHF